MTSADQAAPPTRSALRRQLLSRRNALEPVLKEAWDAAIQRQVLAWHDATQVATLGVYWPIHSEPDLQAAYAALAARGVQLALPVVIDRESPLKFARWAPGEAVRAGALGVPVPAVLVWTQPQALLLPCLGFSPTRLRLGYGGGFYDRTLAVAPRPAAIGVAYGCTRIDFEPAPHDVALDRIVTEDAFW